MLQLDEPRRHSPAAGPRRQGALTAIWSGIACLLLAGGATTVRTGPAAPIADIAVRCERAYARFDELADRAGTRGGGEARIVGFPYLRTNRFLASYADEPLSTEGFDFWVGEMARLDRHARLAELDNVPPGARPPTIAALREDGWQDADPASILAGCARVLADRQLSDADSRARLREAARVPDDYDGWKRVVGLYPLTSLPFALGVSRYQARVQSVFDAPLATRPRTGSLVRYAPRESAPLAPNEVAAVLADSRSNPLGIPIPEGSALIHLFATFAPILEIDEADANDRIGLPTFTQDGATTVDLARPVMLTRVAHTRVGDGVLLQLVYSFWFPARPKTGALDLLGGTLDGITWRVTLSADGVPLVYDTIHNCGCYHMFFPTLRVRLRPQAPTPEEAAFVPQDLPEVAPGNRLVLRIASATHYIERVMVERGDPGAHRREYVFAPDDWLRSLPRPDGSRRSLFGPDGIVAGTERGERYLFWPMGVPEPGAMREWGRHATAFVGRRHFDEARLIERYFTAP